MRFLNITDVMKNNMEKLTFPLLVFLVMLSSVETHAQLKIPKGYTEIKTSPVNGGMMKRTPVHLDDDNKPDQASIISLKDKPTEDVMLVLYFTKTKTQEIIRLNPSQEKEIFTFPLRVVNNNLEVAYGMKGDKNFARYIRIGYSAEQNATIVTQYETYFKSDGKSALKTYNCLTGAYKIDYSDLDPASNKVYRNALLGEYKKEPLQIAKLTTEFLDNIDAVMLAKENEKVVAEATIEKPTIKKKPTNGKKKKGR